MVHVRIGIDTSMNNKGSMYLTGKRDGLELEVCVALMTMLQWSYEIITYDNNLGVIFDNGTGTGLLGDVLEGVVDMGCGRFLMTPVRMEYLKFSYPIQQKINQMYILTNPGRTADAGFLLQPFNLDSWLIVLASSILSFAMFAVIRIAEVHTTSTPESTILSVWKSLKHWVSSSLGFTLSSSPLRFNTHYIFTALWMMVWFHIFIDYYTSELRGMLIVSNRKIVPFSDFKGLLTALQSSKYRLVTSSEDRIPECSAEFADHCKELFVEIFRYNPPLISSNRIFEDKAFIEQQEHPLVGFEWYPENRAQGALSQWTQYSFHSNTWVIKDFEVSVAGIPLGPHFKHIKQFNTAITKILPGLETIDNHYTPTYPLVPVVETPLWSPFTIRQLQRLFGTVVSGCAISTAFCILEIFTHIYNPLGKFRSRFLARGDRKNNTKPEDEHIMERDEDQSTNWTLNI